ncbi:MAG: hypothetical protein MUF10_14225 [Thermoanaerobaculaceae bacterium]|nr:hypothetical protein [Thermoanaerobaculaceae bacterium]
MRQHARTAWLPVVAAVVALAGMAGQAGAQVALSGLSSDLLAARQRADAGSLILYREGLLRVVGFLETRPDLVPVARPAAPRLLGAVQREELLLAWKSFLDYLLALDSISRLHHDFQDLPKGGREISFVIDAAAFLAQYRSALDLLALLDRDPSLAVLLDEAVPELGLPAGTYSGVRLRFLHVARAGELAAFEAIDATWDHPAYGGLRPGMEEDRRAIWAVGKGKAEVMTLKNAFRVVRQVGFAAWFPVQAGVAGWMGDTRVASRQALVSAAQVKALGERLQPGDILLERREWYLSNVGLPGYWPHAALYVGTPGERERFFATDEVKAWVRGQGVASGGFGELLALREPGAERLEHSAAADAVAVVRPRLPRAAVAAAILRAFHFAGRPYDFNFDFTTDQAIVCTELVAKAFDPQAAPPGLRFPVLKVLGRPATPANEIVRQLDAQWGTDAQQLDLVVFLDGDEKSKQAVEASADVFRGSWRRPKWHIFLPQDGR